MRISDWSSDVCSSDLGATAGKILQTDVDKSAEEGSGGQHHGIREETQAHLRDDTTHLVLLDDQVIGRLLKYPQVRLVFQYFADSGLVQDTVGLGTSSPHGRDRKSTRLNSSP